MKSSISFNNKDTISTKWCPSLIHTLLITYQRPITPVHWWDFHGPFMGQGERGKRMEEGQEKGRGGEGVNKRQTCRKGVRWAKARGKRLRCVGDERWMGWLEASNLPKNKRQTERLVPMTHLAWGRQKKKIVVWVWGWRPYEMPHY